MWAAAGRWTIAWAALLVVEGLLPIATVLLTRTLVNGFVNLVSQPSEARSLAPLLPALAGYVAIVLLWELVAAAGRWVRMVQADLIEDHIAGLIHEKSYQVDLSFYESPEFYDHLHRARDDSGSRSVVILESLGGLAQNGITLLAMVTVLIPLGPWLAVALVLTALPAVYVLLQHAHLEHTWWMANTETLRRGWYYDWLILTDIAAMEVRSFGLGPHFKDRFQELRKHLRDTRLSLLRDRGIAEAQAGILAVAIGGGGGLWMLRQALLGFVTLGDLALAYQAFQQGQAMARTLLGRLGQLYTNMLYLGSLFEFLQLEPRVVDRRATAHAPEHLQEGIRFEQVSFRYPRSDRDALRDLELFIPAGRITAIVGANGSGKSTLIKLLCRFYDPNDGCISIDGVDFRNVPVEDLRQRISATFQQPVRFSASAAENVSYGDLPRAGDERSVRAAVTAAGADEIVGRLPRGYETPLGNWFKGGRELSVGEWQRIALARALFRKAPILLLDEPTSAMDTWAEAEWLSRFRSLVEDRTTLLVTHRFAAAMRADLIHVMAEGRVVESGTHRELISRGGLYARSWASQTSS